MCWGGVGSLWSLGEGGHAGLGQFSGLGWWFGLLMSQMGTYVPCSPLVGKEEEVVVLFGLEGAKGRTVSRAGGGGFPRRHWNREPLLGRGGEGVVEEQGAAGSG